ncbi:MAG TPA: YebC/PmpR family DNA-binding transcriptional regulator [Dehalococcoidia bacterium]|nr:YebC/PmpR family DNA-binding transcriptional regulator [Dehalococcoidia bacterium]
MAGHSKWAQIRRQKGVNDAKRSQIFTKLGREISVAVRQGGPDPDANFRLRLAVQRARDANMPADTIERAIKKAAGEGNTDALEELTYEGYGPGGIAIMVQALTDNRNRTASDVRSVFNKLGGNLGEAGCVAWQFQQAGVVTVEPDGVDADDLALLAIDAGASDVQVTSGQIDVVTPPEALESVKQALEGAKAKILAAEIAMNPTTLVSLDEKQAEQTLRLLDRLDDLDDVQRVYTNADFSTASVDGSG